MVMEVFKYMSHLTYSEHRRAWKRRFHIKWLVIYGLIIQSVKLFKGSFIFYCTYIQQCDSDFDCVDACKMMFPQWPRRAC